MSWTLGDILTPVHDMRSSVTIGTSWQSYEAARTLAVLPSVLLPARENTGIDVPVPLYMLAIVSNMTLAVWSATTKRKIFDDLMEGMAPSLGSFDPVVLADCRAKGNPQMGPTVFSPHSARFEFSYTDASQGTTLFAVTVEPPERIVFLPVPEWVVETIWQGDVDGSYHFETEANHLVDTFRTELNADENAKWFGPQRPKRRE